ncbi:MAG: flavodoxin-dependent (E)-4-hydroxy-3-methylbut-2-enyl-diphosphate synthase [Elusimicrobiota bacterium]
MKMDRNETRKIRIGKTLIGGGAPVAVQSMTKTDTTDVSATVAQIKELEKAGCEIVRVAVPNMESAKCLSKIKKEINIPLVADVHFDYKLAMESILQGADKIRINPGNIGSKGKVRQVVLLAGEKKIPIRVGINAGSLKITFGGAGSSGGRKKERVSPDAKDMVSSALDYIKMFNDWGFFDIVISLKSSDVVTTVEAYTKFAEKSDAPLHLGITESGPPGIGTVKSSVGLGILLHRGIGDTIRVSLTSDPVEEVRVAWLILQSLNLRNYGIDIISCPTCARCRTDIVKVVETLQERAASLRSRTAGKPLRVAIMGCEVNGPGEASHADIGIAAGKNTGLLFKRGRPVRKIAPDEWIEQLILEIERFGE